MLLPTTLHAHILARLKEGGELRINGGSMERMLIRRVDYRCSWPVAIHSLPDMQRNRAAVRTLLRFRKGCELHN
jgi:hypothetical protein